MTRWEAGRRFCIDEERLRYFEDNGLFDCHRQPDGTVDYCDETAEYISFVELLLKAGLDISEVNAYFGSLGDGETSGKQQLKILIKQRYALLEDIHGKQKVLDQLDYIIHEAKKKEGGYET